MPLEDPTEAGPQAPSNPESDTIDAGTEPSAAASGFRSAKVLKILFLVFLALHMPVSLHSPPDEQRPAKLVFPIDTLPDHLSFLPEALRSQVSFWEERFVSHFLEPSVEELFPFPEDLQPQVAFWKEIFTRYTRGQVVIHDDWYLDVIYEVVDLGEVSGWDGVREIVGRHRERLADMAGIWDTPERMDREQRALRAKFDGVAESPRFPVREAAGRVHAQLGQADSMRQGVIFSGAYIEKIRKILDAHGVPRQLAYLPMIESAYNPYAYSYAGAAGMWQFMRATGKQFGLTINHLVDERRDPLLAARAAARLLAHNYSVLRSWPLAITAYNYGLQGMRNAVRRVGSEDIRDIIERFDGPRFDYASRNFYVEFLAAMDVYENRESYYGDLTLDPPMALTRVEIPDHLKAEALEVHCGLRLDDVRKLNPALHASVFKPGGVLPKSHRLNLPAGEEERFRKAYAAVPDDMKLAYVKQNLKHRVRRRQTLSGIAARYKTSVRSLMRANGLTNPRRIRSGQLLTIPGRYVAVAEGGKTARAAAGRKAAKPAAPEAKSKKHRVRRGQTLIRIARLYNTSPRAIASLNAIKNPQKIFAGQILKIPEG